MRKLPYLPDTDGYGFSDPEETVMVQLDGGKPFMRSDVLNGAITLTAQWKLDRNEYEYMRKFYRVTVEKYGGAFLCDLIIDKSTLTEHQCLFVPGSMKLTQQRGHLHVVAANLVVIPIPMDIDYEDSLLDLIDAYGNTDNAQVILNDLDELANVRLGAI
jgi:hypothetical protein